MNKKLIVACATDDKINFTKEHFGEAKEYLVYEVSKTNSHLIETVKNISPEEEMHSDPRKAKGVAVLLKPYNVQVLVNKAFGGNITRMKQKFVVILSNSLSIEETMSKIQLQFDDIVAELEKGEERKHLRI